MKKQHLSILIISLATLLLGCEGDPPPAPKMASETGQKMGDERKTGNEPRRVTILPRNPASPR